MFIIVIVAHMIWVGVINLHDAALMCPITMTTVVRTPIPGCSTIQLDILACCQW